MEISPRELRDIEIREAFRGYHRDEVNELLERASVTIEALTERVRELGDRLAGSADSPQQANRTRDLEEMLERTLLLAKRTADEEVGEAQAKARQLVDDAEAKATKLVMDAELDARRRAEEEHGRIQRELIDMAERRDGLTTAIDELSQFESEYRERLLQSIEADLGVISGRSPAAPGPVPDIPQIDVPALPEAVMTEESMTEESMTEESMTEAPAEAPAEAPVAATVESEATEGLDAQSLLEAAAAKATARHEAETFARGEAADATQADGPTMTATATAPTSDADPVDPGGVQAEGRIDLADEEVVEAEVADDDAFFAQLRDATSEERVLTEQETTFFDQDTDTPAGRELFRRRR